MPHSLLLPKFSPPTRLYLVKVCSLLCLLLLSLLLAPRPAQAQGGGHWGGFPCDAQGNSLPTNTYNNGFYSLYGPQSGTASNTYPVPMINAALAYPSLYGDYLGAAEPSSYEGLGISPQAVSVLGTPNRPNDRVGASTPGFASAENYGYNGEGSYSIDAAHGGPSSGPINGTVTADFSGTLLCYFHMYWSGPGPQPASADFLVSTQLYAQAKVLECESADAIGGLSATAKVTVDAFKETASASVVAGVSSDGVPTVNGFHLVRAAVDPSTGIAEVYVMGTTHWVLSNMVPYATAGRAMIAGGSLVRAGAIPDSRDVAISCPTIETSYYKAPVDSQHTTGQWQHIRNSDGSMSTDSSVQWNTFAAAWENAGASASSGVPFTATASNFTNPSYAWQLTGAGTPDGQTQSFLSSSSATVPLHLYFKPSPDASVGSSSLRVDVQGTDPQGNNPATAANTYGVSWHLPYEVNAPPFSIIYSKSPLGGARVGPVPDGQTLLVQATEQQEIDWGATIDGASAIAAGTGQEEIAGGLEILGALAKVTSWKTDVGPENSYNGATNGPTTWSDAGNNNNEIYGGGNIPTELVGNSSGWMLCNLYIYQYGHYKDTSWYADGYNAHGYDGNSQHVLHVHGVDGVYDEFVFVKYKGPTGIPVPPTRE